MRMTLKCVWPLVFQVQEIYTSGGDLHLELPNGEKEAHKEFWVGMIKWYRWPMTMCDIIMSTCSSIWDIVGFSICDIMGTRICDIMGTMYWYLW